MCFFKRPQLMQLKEVSFDTCVYKDKWKSDETISIHAVNLGLQSWHSPDYVHVRCYVNCQAIMPLGSKRRSRWYELGWIGPSGATGGVHNGEQFRWGNATPEQQRAVIFAARAAIRETPNSDRDDGPGGDGNEDEYDDGQTAKEPPEGGSES